MKWHRFLILILTLLAVLIGTGFFATAQAENELHWTYYKQDVLYFLTDWRDQIQQDPYLNDHEKDLRQQFIGRLIFQVDRKYFEQNFRQFLIETTWDMSLTDEMKVNRIYETDSVFLKNLNAALKDVLEPAENILHFLRNYVEFSSLRSPKTVAEFADTRAYTNGAEIIPASTIEMESALASAADIINELESQPTQRKWLDFNRDLQHEVEISTNPENSPADKENAANSGN